MARVDARCRGMREEKRREEREDCGTDCGQCTQSALCLHAFTRVQVRKKEVVVVEELKVEDQVARVVVVGKKK